MKRVKMSSRVENAVQPSVLNPLKFSYSESKCSSNDGDVLYCHALMQLQAVKGTNRNTVFLCSICLLTLKMTSTMKKAKERCLAREREDEKRAEKEERSIASSCKEVVSPSRRLTAS